MGYKISVGGKKFDVEIGPILDGQARVSVNNQVYDVVVDNFTEVAAGIPPAPAAEAPVIPRKVDASGMITTVAGNGTAGSSGDGGPAILASLRTPQGVFVDATGNLYITDGINNRIRKVDAAGIIDTIAGGWLGDGGPATAATLAGPKGVAWDASGNVYIADANNQRIRKISPSGLITTIAGNGTTGYSGDGGPASSAGLNGPWGIDVDAAGNVYIADASNNRIRRIDASGVITTVAGSGTTVFSGDGGPATEAGLSMPQAVAVDASGNIYIADTGHYRTEGGYVRDHHDGGGKREHVIFRRRRPGHVGRAIPTARPFGWFLRQPVHR